jgi:copper chaperone
MTAEKINIENLKCHGCANTISRGVSGLEGVTNVQVNIEDSSVSFNYDESKQNKENIVKKLARLGYPEKGKNSLKSSAVSYVSCAIGRVKK